MFDNPDAGVDFAYSWSLTAYKLVHMALCVQDRC